MAELKINYKISVPEPDIVYVRLSRWQKWFGSYFREYDTVSAEMYLKGQYTKWTNNAGYINKRAEGIDIMEAFQHYTYVKSGYDIICCDLQGVKV